MSRKARTGMNYIFFKVLCSASTRTFFWHSAISGNSVAFKYMKNKYPFFLWWSWCWYVPTVKVTMLLWNSKVLAVTFKTTANVTKHNRQELCIWAWKPRNLHKHKRTLTCSTKLRCNLNKTTMRNNSRYLKIFVRGRQKDNSHLGDTVTYCVKAYRGLLGRLKLLSSTNVPMVPRRRPSPPRMSKITNPFPKCDFFRTAYDGQNTKAQYSLVLHTNVTTRYVTGISFCTDINRTNLIFCAHNDNIRNA
jgi:hypothetical protein